VRFASATEWVARLQEAKRERRLSEELRNLARIPLIVCDLGRHRDYADMPRARAGNARSERLRELLALALVGIVPHPD